MEIPENGVIYLQEDGRHYKGRKTDKDKTANPSTILA
jgi:hypothetical protein